MDGCLAGPAVLLLALFGCRASRGVPSPPSRAEYRPSLVLLAGVLMITQGCLIDRADATPIADEPVAV